MGANELMAEAASGSGGYRPQPGAQDIMRMSQGNRMQGGGQGLYAASLPPEQQETKRKIDEYTAQMMQRYKADMLKNGAPAEMVKMIPDNPTDEQLDAMKNSIARQLDYMNGHSIGTTEKALLRVSRGEKILDQSTGETVAENPWKSPEEPESLRGQRESTAALNREKVNTEKARQAKLRSRGSDNGWEVKADRKGLDEYNKAKSFLATVPKSAYSTFDEYTKQERVTNPALQSKVLQAASIVKAYEDSHGGTPAQSGVQNKQPAMPGGKKSYTLLKSSGPVLESPGPIK